MIIKINHFKDFHSEPWSTICKVLIGLKGSKRLTFNDFEIDNCRKNRKKIAQYVRKNQVIITKID